MKENKKYEKVREFSTLIGGNARYYLHLIFYYLKIRNKKPIKTEYLLAPNKEDDYYGNSNFNFRNTITSIIVTFFVLSIISKLLKILFL